IQAIAIDGSDRVFAATSPDGKVYEIGGGKPSVFFEPKAKYIWAMAFHGDNLFVATGAPGQIFRVTPDGKSSLFFKTEETHARSLAIDSEGNLLVGTDPGGLVIRVSPSGQGFVLYQTPKSEVAALAVAPNGDIYAAALGAKGSAPVTPLSPSAIAIVPSPSPTVPGAAVRAETAFPPVSHIAAASAGGSEIFRIERDGSTRRVWSDGQALVYAMAFDASGHALLGTGNRGIIYRIDSPLLSTRLTDLAPTQVTAFCSSPDGPLYAITGNVGTVFRIGPGIASEGTFESDTLDSGWFSRWGRLSLNRGASGASIWTRSGNLDRPQQNWSEWQPVSIADGSGVVASPAARFLQY
ncbi:MAG: hypothetical protein ACRD5L_01265, partial [Bryobacteraceae bacterium]